MIEAFATCPAVKKSRRRCRAFQHATRDVIDRAVCSWQAISGLTCPPFSPEDGLSCSDFARAVKKFLASSVSDDVSLQMGFQSIKKLLPDSCRCMESGLLDDLVNRLGSAPRVLPVGYLSFVKKETSRLFPKGWDASYEGYCLTTSPPLTSCCEAGRSAGGSLGTLSMGQSGFLDRVLHGLGPRLCPRYCGELLVVQSAGKPRPLSKFPAEALFLKPLHKTIYGNLSKRDWLLRGPPSKESLHRAGFREGGGRLVSGDYRSATDNLPIEVMEAALDVMLSNAISVPDNVKELARRACRPILFSDSDSLEVRVGQMMGSLLSFPFLCLQNYLSFRWAVRSTGRTGRVPVLINGDDILFQTNDLDFPDRWFKVVSLVGLEVEETKTSVEDGWGTLNSTLLRWVDHSLQPVWSPRFGMLRPAEYPGSLGRSFLDFLRGSPTCYRFKAGREFFSWHVSEMRSARISLDKLGFRGLLAIRLASIFHLLHFRGGELPRPPLKHGVGMCADFVTHVPPDLLDDELRFSGSVEVAAGKWSEGWAPVKSTREAILYCLSRTSAKGDRFDYPLVAPWFSAEDAEFRFRLTAGRLHGWDRPSRAEVRKAFLAPFPAPLEVPFPWSVLMSLAHDFGRGSLPPYSELPGPGEYHQESAVLMVCG